MSDHAVAPTGATETVAQVLYSDSGLVVSIHATPRQPAPAAAQADVSKLPGAVWVANLAQSSAHSQLLAGCVRGPSDRFAPGVEDLLFEKATFLALKTAQSQPHELARTHRELTDRSRVDVADGRDDGGHIRLINTLNFVGADSDVLVCSITCRGIAEECRSTSLTLEGELAPAPEPSMVVRAVLAAAHAPRHFVGGAFVLGMVLLGVLLARRPRPRQHL